MLQRGDFIANDQHQFVQFLKLSGLASITLGIDGASQHVSFGTSLYTSETLTVQNWSSDPTSNTIYFVSTPDQEFPDTIFFEGCAPWMSR